MKIRCCHLVQFPCHKVTQHKEFHFLIFNVAIQTNAEKTFGLSGLVLQSNNSNCLVLVMHRQFGNICLVLWTAMVQQPNIFTRVYESMFDTYQIWLTKAKDGMLTESCW